VIRLTRFVMGQDQKKGRVTPLFGRPVHYNPTNAYEGSLKENWRGERRAVSERTGFLDQKGALEWRLLVESEKGGK